MPALLTEIPLIPRPETLATNGWTGAVLLGLMLTFALCYAISRQQYRRRLEALRRGRDRYVSYGESEGSTIADIMLGIVVVSGIGLGLLTVGARFAGIEANLKHYAMAVGAVVAFYLFKFGIIYWLRMVFDIRSTAISAEILYKTLFVGLMAIIAAAMAIYLPYDTAVLIIAAAVPVIAIVWETVKVVQNFSAGLWGLFYIILYLCAVEIVPILVVAKVAFRTLI